MYLFNIKTEILMCPKSEFLLLPCGSLSTKFDQNMVTFEFSGYKNEKTHQMCLKSDTNLAVLLTVIWSAMHGKILHSDSHN